MVPIRGRAALASNIATRSPAFRVHGLYEVRRTRLPGKPTASIEFFRVIRAVRFLECRVEPTFVQIDIETLKSSERLLLCAPEQGKIDPPGEVEDGQLGRLVTLDNRLDDSR